MRNGTIKTFVVLAIVSIVGIIVTQIFWFKQAFDKTEQEFNRSLNIALTQTLKGILLYNNSSVLPVDPIQKLDHNYFAVMVNDQINADVLEHYLRNEFDKLNIHQSFEYRIFDCKNEQLVYGGYVEGKMSDDEETVRRNLPVWKPDNYYFTVYFPNKTLDIVSGMSLWLFSSFVLFVVLIFFAYSLFVILKQKRLSEIQKDFINNMTHEIKTPVSIISASAETIRNPTIVEQPQRLLTYANIIIEESNRLKAQVERVLTLADSNRTIKLNIEKINLEELTRTIVDSLSEKEKNNIDIIYEFKASNTFVMGDEIYLSQLISNIVDNAIKYSKDKLILKIQTYNTNQSISIVFTDNGLGIAKEHLNKIFDKFYRVPTGNRHDVKGFGIGLNYVKLIAKLHKAKVSVDSVLGEGTSFTIKFPNA